MLLDYRSHLRSWSDSRNHRGNNRSRHHRGNYRRGDDRSRNSRRDHFSCSRTCRICTRSTASCCGRIAFIDDEYFALALLLFLLQGIHKCLVAFIHVENIEPEGWVLDVLQHLNSDLHGFHRPEVDGGNTNIGVVAHLERLVNGSIGLQVLAVLDLEFTDAGPVVRRPNLDDGGLDNLV